MLLSPIGSPNKTLDRFILPDDEDDSDSDVYTHGHTPESARGRGYEHGLGLAFGAGGGGGIVGGSRGRRRRRVQLRVPIEIVLYVIELALEDREWERDGAGGSSGGGSNGSSGGGGGNGGGGHGNPHQTWKRCAASLCLVSSWVREATLPHLYRTILVKDSMSSIFHPSTRTLSSLSPLPLPSSSSHFTPPTHSFSIATPPITSHWGQSTGQRRRLSSPIRYVKHLWVDVPWERWPHGIEESPGLVQLAMHLEAREMVLGAERDVEVYKPPVVVPIVNTMETTMEAMSLDGEGSVDENRNGSRTSLQLQLDSITNNADHAFFLSSPTHSNFQPDLTFAPTPTSPISPTTPTSPTFSLAPAPSSFPSIMTPSVSTSTSTSTSSSSPPPPTIRSFTVLGQSHPSRWHPFTTTPSGLRFLSNITHLRLLNMCLSSYIPLEHMPNLTHLCVPFFDLRPGSVIGAGGGAGGGNVGGGAGGGGGVGGHVIPIGPEGFPILDQANAPTLFEDTNINTNTNTNTPSIPTPPSPSEFTILLPLLTLRTPHLHMIVLTLNPRYWRFAHMSLKKWARRAMLLDERLYVVASTRDDATRDWEDPKRDWEAEARGGSLGTSGKDARERERDGSESAGTDGESSEDTDASGGVWERAKKTREKFEARSWE